MKRYGWMIMGLAAVLVAGQVEAYTSKGKSTISVGASGVAETTTFTTAVVAQGAGDTSGVVPITFGAGGNNFRNSGAAIRINVNTNSAGNRIIIYTDNLAPTANPKAEVDTGTGIDGGGLVGVSDKTQFVPLLWTITDSNSSVFQFDTATIGDNEIFVTDRAHVASFVRPIGSGNDNRAMVKCDNASQTIPNTSGDGLYPQFFGNPGTNEDLCDAAAPSTVISQELSKNIAVLAFGCTGTICNVPNLSTPNPADNLQFTSPFFVNIGADFTNAAPQNYATSTLTVELVTP